MHITHILRCMAERMGGPPRSTRGLGDAVARRGHQVAYWSAANAEDMAELASSGPEIVPHPMSWPHAWYRSTSLATNLSRQIPHIDLLHVHGVWSYPHYLAARIGRQSDTPYIIAPRGELEPWRVRNSRVKYLKKQLYLGLLGHRMLKNAACMHAITPCEIDGFRQAGYRGPVTIVPNGVDVERFAQLPSPTAAEERWPSLKGRRVVLFLSRLKEEKGLNQLLPAWHQLVKQLCGFEDALLVIAGPDDRGYRMVVQHMIEKYDLEKHTLLTGIVRGQEKLALMSRSNIYTLPSYSEGFSMSVLENLAASKPVLITPGCNFPEVAAADAGLCVQPQSGPLAEALRTMLDMSDAQRQAMGRRGHELVARDYSWPRLGEKMLTVYRCILEGRDIPLYPECDSSVQAAA